MVKYWLCLCISWFAHTGEAQDLNSAVQAINPALYIHNIDNQLVYIQCAVEKNLLLFKRSYWVGNEQQKEQKYQYFFLNYCHQNWVLEIRSDQYGFHISKDKNMKPICSSDFGINVYHLQEEQWQNVTDKVLPQNFTKKFHIQFPDLQTSHWNYYYYNQNPQQAVYPIFRHKKLCFLQNGKKVLCLAWRKKHFIWK